MKNNLKGYPENMKIKTGFFFAWLWPAFVEGQIDANYDYLHEQEGEVKKVYKFEKVNQAAVFLLDEVLKYNPDFDYHINRSWTTTLIKDFEGEVDFEVIDDEYGEPEVQVAGKGNVNFVGKLTGL